MTRSKVLPIGVLALMGGLACGPLVAYVAGCDLLRSPPAKVVTNTAKDVVVDIAVAECVAAAESLDVGELAILCHAAPAIIDRLAGAKRAGLERVAAKRGGYRDAYDAGAVP